MKLTADPSEQRFFYLFGGVFGAIGVLFLVLGIASLVSSWRLLDLGVRSQGVVTGFVSSRTPQPKVRFVDETGRTIEFVSRAGSNPPAYDVGERVEVLYPQGKPERAVIHGFFSLWGFAVIGGGLGLIATVIGIFGVAAGIRAARRARELATQGIVIDTDFTTVERISDDDGVVFFVRSQWLSPTTREMHVFESDALRFDPSRFIQPGQRIRVRINPANPANYQMDMGFLPREAGR